MYHPVLGARVDAAVRHAGERCYFIAYIRNLPPGAATVPRVIEDPADGHDNLKVRDPVDMTPAPGGRHRERRPGPPGQAPVSGPIEVGRARRAGSQEQQAVSAAQVAGKRLDGPGSRLPTYPNRQTSPVKGPEKNHRDYAVFVNRLQSRNSRNPPGNPTSHLPSVQTAPSGHAAEKRQHYPADPKAPPHSRHRRYATAQAKHSHPYRHQPAPRKIHSPSICTSKRDIQQDSNHQGLTKPRPYPQEPPAPKRRFRLFDPDS